MKFFYDIYFDNIQIGNEQLKNINKIAELKPDFGLIVAANGFKKNIDDLFFNKYYLKEICTSDFIYKTFWEIWERDEDDEDQFDYECGTNDAFKIIVCNEKIDVKKFPSLKFYNKDFEFSFELNYKDLFKKYKNKYYFLIVEQNIYSNFNWKFGTPFLKKYELTFDQDRKTISYYLKSNDNNYVNSNNDNKFNFLIVEQNIYNNYNWKFGTPFLKKYELTFDQDKKTINFYVNNNKKFNYLWLIIIILLIIIVILIYVLKKKIFLKLKGKKNKDIDFEGKTNYTKLGI